MAITIVSEIVDAIKAELGVLMPEFSLLDYEFDISKNSGSDMAKKFGLIPTEAGFKEGSALGFTTMDHNFQLVLSTDYMNKDCDKPQYDALKELYAEVHGVLKALQKKSVILPTASWRVLLVSGLGFENPEFFDDNGIVVLRTNFQIQYRFRNNI